MDPHEKVWQAGDSLPTLRYKLSREKIRRYAETTGDMNPIHLDQDFALHTPYKGIIAHGMLLLAYIAEMLTVSFGMSWLTRGSLSVRFKRPAYAEDEITTASNIESVNYSDSGCQISCQVFCYNQHHDILVSGRATVTLKED